MMPDCIASIAWVNGDAIPNIATCDGINSNGNNNPLMKSNGRPITSEVKNAVASDSEYNAIKTPIATKTKILSINACIKKNVKLKSIIEKAPYNIEDNAKSNNTEGNITIV